MWMFWLALASAAPERCDGVDDDGDGLVDEGPVWSAPDLDGDGFGDAAAAVLVATCAELTADRVSDAGDHDDDDDTRFPGAPEACNGLDDDGDGEVDEAACGCDAYLVDDTDVLQVCTGNPLPWSAAVAACAGAGYHLVTARTPTEQDSLYDTVAPYARDFWIGFDDLGVEGTFTWINGSAVSYTNWRANEPNDSMGNEDCAEIEPAGLWDDENCAVAQAFVCELNCVPQLWFTDADGDGLGDPSSATEACDPPSKAVRNAADCDDGDASLPRIGFLDLDADGFGAGDALLDCVGDLAPADDDCDDGDENVAPDVVEIAGNGVDEDCDGDDLPAEVLPDDTGADDTGAEGTDTDVDDTGAEEEGTESTGTGGPLGDPTETGLPRIDAEDPPSLDPDGSPRASLPPRGAGPADYGFGLGCDASGGAARGWLALLGLLGLRFRR